MEKPKQYTVFKDKKCDYKSVIIVMLDSLLFGETHTFSSSGESINVYLREGYELIIFENSEVELKYIDENYYVKILYDGYDPMEAINVYKNIIN